MGVFVHLLFQVLASIITIDTASTGGIGVIAVGDECTETTSIVVAVR